MSMKSLFANLLVVTLWSVQCHAADTFTNVIAKAKQSTAERYVAARNQLVNVGKKKPDALRALVASSSDWQDRTVAAIALEHVEKEGAIKDVLQWEPRKVSERVPSDRIRIYGEMLKERAHNVPLLLVERIWKGNELRVRSDDAEDIACVAYALGVLKVPESRQPLEALLDHEDYQVRLTAAQALGTLGSPDSVKPLLAFLAKGFGGKVDISHAAASEALSKCVNQDSLPVLKKTLDNVEAGVLKDQRNEFKALLKLQIMALDK